MKKLLFVLSVTFLITLSSCNFSTVEFPNGQRVSVFNKIYELGDTVCISHSIYGDEISSSYWRDTTICVYGADSTRSCMVFRIGMIVDK